MCGLSSFDVPFTSEKSRVTFSAPCASTMRRAAAHDPMPPENITTYFI
jgi:hypothetical protein